jgi:glycosyltransferase involved in cell wall biosynthesis
MIPAKSTCSKEMKVRAGHKAIGGERPMKVLIVVTSISRMGGGVSEVVRLTAEALRARGDVSVEIAACRDNMTDVDLPLCTGTSVFVFNNWLPNRFGFSPGLLRHLFRTDADIVHVHGLWQFHCAAVFIWSLVTERPFVVTPHGMLDAWILERSAFLKLLVGKLFHNAFLRRSCCFQALTRKEVGDIRAVSPRSVCRVIPNYVPCRSPWAQVPPDWWQAEFSGKDIFLFFGRIHAKKGCIELLRAWDEACTREASLRHAGALVFCGWNDGLGEFEAALAEVAARQGNVIFGGPQFGDDRLRTLQAATFVVLPSLSEGLPMVILEAWAVGKPVLMTIECNLPIGFQQNAAIQLETDVPRLVEGLLLAHALDPDRRGEMSRQALDLVEAEFSAERVVDALIEMYVAATTEVARGKRNRHKSDME